MNVLPILSSCTSVAPRDVAPYDTVERRATGVAAGPPRGCDDCPTATPTSTPHPTNVTPPMPQSMGPGRSAAAGGGWGSRRRWGCLQPMCLLPCLSGVGAGCIISLQHAGPCRMRNSTTRLTRDLGEKSRACHAPRITHSSPPMLPQSFHTHLYVIALSFHTMKASLASLMLLALLATASAATMAPGVPAACKSAFPGTGMVAEMALLAAGAGIKAACPPPSAVKGKALPCSAACKAALSKVGPAPPALPCCCRRRARRHRRRRRRAVISRTGPPQPTT